MKLINFAQLNGGWIFLIIVAIFAVIGCGAFLIHFLLKRTKPTEEKPTEEKVAQEKVDSLLEDIDNEATLKEFKEFEEKNKKEEHK